MKLLSVVFSILASTNPFPGQPDLASKPLRSTYRKDVDGDGRPDKFIYEVKRRETDYEGSLRIISAKGNVLWEHQFLLLEKDLLGDPDWLGGKSVEYWVKNFFKGVAYGAEVESLKLKPSDLDDEERLAAFAKRYGTSLGKLRRGILSQEVNTVFSYRAEWREDLNMLVYVPSIGRLVCYKRGY